MQSVPLTPELPPKNFPRLTFTCLPFAPGLGSVTMFQSASVSKFWDLNINERWKFTSSLRHGSYHPPTITVFSKSELCWPASITRTDTFVSSARRAATTLPDVPPLPMLIRLCPVRYSGVSSLPADDVVVGRTPRFERDRACHCWIRFLRS